MLRDQVETHQILRVVTGSHAYGLNVPTSDRDEKAVVIEPICEVAGLAEPWGGKVYSQAGTEDFEVYGLRKYLRLALKGNPTVTEMLFIRPSAMTMVGTEMQSLWPLIISKHSAAAYLGYMEQQRGRMIGARGNGGHGQPRTELVEQHGFDTKFAMHMLRLGLQGIELLTTGKLTLPIEGENRAYLRAVRNGDWSYDHCIARAHDLEKQLQELKVTSQVRPEPDREAVERWMLGAYSEAWSAGAVAQDATSRIPLFAQTLITRLFAPNVALPSGTMVSGPAGVSEKK